MDFKYDSTIEHKGVLFYVAGGGTKAYFFCGGCLIAISRPVLDDGLCGEIAKFGLTLRGLQGKERLMANYVRTELCRRGMKWALPPEGGEMFIDMVDMLNHDAGCSERDLCGHKEVSVQDPVLAEHIVSFCVASGLLITVAKDSPEERVIHLFDSPTTINAYTGFVYETDERVFALTQARLTDLPQSLINLAEGLFDGIPIRRKGLVGEEECSDRVDVVITSARAAATTTVMQRMANKIRLHARDATTDDYQADGKSASSAGARKKSAAISAFVQVKYIPRVVNIWRFRGDGGGGRPTKSLVHLWAVYCRADVALSEETECWEGLEPELDNSRDKINAAIEATFGRGSPPFVGGSLPKNVTPTQKFVILQYTQARLNLPTCYPLIEHLCLSYAADPEAFPAPPLEEHALADTVNALFRSATFAGAAAEVVARNDFRGADAVPDDDTPPHFDSLVQDANVLLETAEDLLDLLLPTPQYNEVRVDKMTHILDRLYRGEDLARIASSECRTMDNSDLMCVALDVIASSAFADTPMTRHMGVYVSALIDARLKEAGVPSFCP
ncbi:tegument protein UL21 [Falconid herpesvirus 1]|uniref:Tegument protein UL21 n=2 Tax=Columbid alphaherpesvirus 1 TaxID=93386 RepID=A0A068EPI5_9ALPH|nr:tegument protein UL21 [Falconid herpesvirus 1]YP_009352927.1 tegument protein UL21 [Columbid alphaherpesvirus 1]AID52723.1 tegument protein UL21 [Falconid herpesvirus 1]ARD71344.1 tegument protein UL21 [Columbid alphaherpesvirus 1]